MYDWLPEALGDNGVVVTANRRVARVLQEEFGQQQVAAGKTAWLSPRVFGWHDWLCALIEAAVSNDTIPARLSSQQAAVLWERCLRSEMSESLVNIGGLVRLSSEAWTRIHDWELSLDDCRRFAHSADQRLFAAAARRYTAALARDKLIDDAGRLGLVRKLLFDGCIAVPDRLTLAGFDRVIPNTRRFLDELGEQGTRVFHTRAASGARPTTIHAYENTDAELRAAGAWARKRLEEDSARRIAIVSSGLDQDAERMKRLVLEGLAPGWQYGSASHAAALNVSYGRKLAAFPAVAIALLALRWIVDDLSGREVSLLLRSPLIGSSTVDGRTRLELYLRKQPDRNWSPTLATRVLNGRDDGKDAEDWLERVATLAEHRRSRPQKASPTEWAEWIDAVLQQLDWPGETTLGSREFQLVNRWRELLNDLARLEIVSPEMTCAQALGRLSILAGETVFQPEATGAAVNLLGPLEAAGMEFDDLWLAGLSASQWPPSGRPSPLLSRRLQREYGMPDADPGDTADYARRVLDRLADSTTTLHCSFPMTEGDAEQSATTLLGDLEVATAGAICDWHASDLLLHRSLKEADTDPVPAVADDETVAGGAATVQKQLGNPFAAFAAGRLGIRDVPLIVPGLAANLRGNLVHDALQSLYADCPSQAEICSWNDEQTAERIAAAAHKAFSRYERHADSVLKRLLALERRRVEILLRGVVALDIGRRSFSIRSVEGKAESVLEGVRLSLRYDRIDELDDGGLAILDYKTGAKKRLLDTHDVPRDFQLVVYACTLPRDVAGLALVNIDSREISIDGAGEPFGDGDDWHRRLAGWKAAVRSAIEVIRRGDVRVNAQQGIKEARALSLLSRFPELRREH